MKHDYKAALKRFDKHLTTADPNATGKTLGLLVGAYFHNDEIVAIRKALKIAEKLMQEPSREMVQHTKTGWHHSTVFTVMRDQMLKEIEW